MKWNENGMDGDKDNPFIVRQNKRHSNPNKKSKKHDL